MNSNRQLAMIQTVREKNQYMTPETEAVDLRMEPMQGFCSDTTPIGGNNPGDDQEVPF